MASDGDKPVYSIGAVARMLDIPASTLRAWQDRYGIVSPSRSSGAQRLYSRAQVEQLRFIKGQIDAGMSAADAHRLLPADLSGEQLADAVVDVARDDRPLILVAEKDEYAAELAAYFLRAEGWHVTTALDPVQATLQFKDRSPDLVVLELLIAGGDGYRLIADFTDRRPVQIVAVSAMESGDEAIRLGAAAFLQKPLEPAALLSTVRDLLGKTGPTRHTQGTI